MHRFLSNELPLTIYLLVRTFSIMEKLPPHILATNHLEGQTPRISIV